MTHHQEVADLMALNGQLLEALTALLNVHWPYVETQDYEDPFCAQARAAIARATGAQS